MGCVRDSRKAFPPSVGVQEEEIRESEERGHALLTHLSLHVHLLVRDQRRFPDFAYIARAGRVTHLIDMLIIR